MAAEFFETLRKKAKEACELSDGTNLMDREVPAVDSDGRPWIRLTENSATLLLREEEVFYNPVQEFNRDLVRTLTFFWGGCVFRLLLP